MYCKLCDKKNGISLPDRCICGRQPTIAHFGNLTEWNICCFSGCELNSGFYFDFHLAVDAWNKLIKQQEKLQRSCRTESKYV